MQKTNRNTMKRLLQYCGIFVVTLLLGILMTTSIFAADESTAKGSYTSFSTARYLANGSKVSGSLTSDDLVDYYRITVPSTQKVVFNYNTSVYDSMFYLYNSSKSVIDSENYYYVTSGTKNYQYTNTLSAGTYYIQIKPYSTHSYTGTYQLSFSMPNYTPSGLVAPLNLKVTGTNYKSVRVSWGKVNNVSGYHLYVSNTLNGYYKKCATVKSNTKTYVDLTNLVPGKNYFFKVQTYKGTGKSAFSSRVSGQTKQSYATITSLTTSGTSATLKWTKVSGAHAYHILRATGSGSFVDIKTVNASTSSFTNTGLKAGTQYRYSIRVSYQISGKYYLGTRCAAKSITTYAAAKYRALLIGESNYSSTSASNLSGPANDITVMQRMLQNMKKPYSVSKRSNQTKSQILSAITSTFKGATSNDVSLFYYSGHGVTSSGTYSGALYAVDGNTITTAELAAALKKVPGKVIVLLDSCGSGAAVTKDGSVMTMDADVFASSVYNAFAAADTTINAKSGELATSKFIVMCAAAKGQYSYDASISGSMYGGMFTYNLAKGAGCSYPYGYYSGSMPADYNSNGRLTLAELYRYVNSKVSSSQTTVVYPSTSSTYNVFLRK